MSLATFTTFGARAGATLGPVHLLTTLLRLHSLEILLVASLVGHRGATVALLCRTFATVLLLLRSCTRGALTTISLLLCRCTCGRALSSLLHGRGTLLCSSRRLLLSLLGRLLSRSLTLASSRGSLPGSPRTTRSGASLKSVCSRYTRGLNVKSRGRLIGKDPLGALTRRFDLAGGIPCPR